MTKKQYLQKVKKKMNLPNGMKSNILYELQELFISAEEHGENESAVIARLGTPEDFVNEVMQNTELSDVQIKLIKRKHIIRASAIAVLVVNIIVTGLIFLNLFKFRNAIGGAVTPTDISVIGGFGYLLPIIFCVLLWLLAVIMIVNLIYVNKKLNE